MGNSISTTPKPVHLSLPITSSNVDHELLEALTKPFAGTIVVGEKRTAGNIARAECQCIVAANRLVLWSDSSEGITFAVTSQDRADLNKWEDHPYKLETHISNNYVEMFGVAKALDLAYETCRTSMATEILYVTVYTDSIFALEKVRDFHTYTPNRRTKFERQRELAALKYKAGMLHSMGVDVQLRWSPKAAKAAGNVRADKIAGEARKAGTDVQIYGVLDDGSTNHTTDAGPTRKKQHANINAGTGKVKLDARQENKSWRSILLAAGRTLSSSIHLVGDAATEAKTEQPSKKRRRGGTRGQMQQNLAPIAAKKRMLRHTHIDSSLTPDPDTDRVADDTVGSTETRLASTPSTGMFQWMGSEGLELLERRVRQQLGEIPPMLLVDIIQSRDAARAELMSGNKEAVFRLFQQTDIAIAFYQKCGFLC